jgi:hypothetical protein
MAAWCWCFRWLRDVGVSDDYVMSVFQMAMWCWCFRWLRDVGVSDGYMMLVFQMTTWCRCFRWLRDVGVSDDYVMLVFQMTTWCWCAQAWAPVVSRRTYVPWWTMASQAATGWLYSTTWDVCLTSNWQLPGYSAMVSHVVVTKHNICTVYKLPHPTSDTCDVCLTQHLQFPRYSALTFTTLTFCYSIYCLPLAYFGWKTPKTSTDE